MIRKIIFILLLVGFSIGSDSGLGLIKNIIIPGMGMPKTEEYQNLKKNYLLREVVIWGTLFSSRQNSNMYENNYINYGVEYGETDVSDYNYQYAINVGDYDSFSEYNDAMLRKRLSERVYPQNQGYEWDWESRDNRLKYRNMLRTSRDLDKIGDFAIAGLLIHRIVAVINYAYLMNKGKSLGLSSNIYKKDSQTIQLEFKFNL